MNATNKRGEKVKDDLWLAEQNRLRAKYQIPLLEKNDLEVEGKEDRGELSSDDSSDEEDEFQAQREAYTTGPSPQVPDPVAVLEDEDGEDVVLGDFALDLLLGEEDDENAAQAAHIPGDVPVQVALEEQQEVDDDSALDELIAQLTED